MHLHPTQVAYRLRVTAQRWAVRRKPDRYATRWQAALPANPGLPAGFRAIDEPLLARDWSPADLAMGRFDLLNESRDLGWPVNWEPADATQLWSFHLHYWEWAWALVAGGDQERATLIDLIDQWEQATTFGHWDAWAPYPASLRAWVLVNIHRHLADQPEAAHRLSRLVARHAGFLAHNLELDVGGNHIIKNIKGLIGCGVFLDDHALIDVALRHLMRELGVQVLPDGGHYELSPSYHCQVLADLIDMADLLAADGRPAVPDLDDAISRMRVWLGLMVMPDGSLPLFNDCEPVASERLAALRPGPGSSQPLTVLADSGYAVARVGPVHLVADVGQPGPPTPPGHIHADCLSFALHLNGQPTVVDSGTSEYGAGPRRAHERSTAAHNTVEVDGHSQSEVFGAFRTGRRARATLERAEVTSDGVVEIVASHDGYRFLPGRPRHRRSWRITPALIELLDEVTGSETHRVSARLHLPASVEVVTSALDNPTCSADQPHQRLSVSVSARSAVGATADEELSVQVSPTEVAQGFGHLVAASLAETHVTVELPATFVTQLRPHPQKALRSADRP